MYGKAKNQKLTETEYITLTGAIQKTAKYELSEYKDIMKGVESVMAELLEIPELEALKNAVKEAERKTAIEIQRKTAIEILSDMYKNKMDIGYIIKLADKNGISKEELSTILNIEQH